MTERGLTVTARSGEVRIAGASMREVAATISEYDGEVSEIRRGSLESAMREGAE